MTFKDKIKEIADERELIPFHSSKLAHNVNCKICDKLNFLDGTLKGMKLGRLETLKEILDKWENENYSDEKNSTIKWIEKEIAELEA